MSYAIQYRASVKKDMCGLDATTLRRVDVAILALADSPRPAGCVTLSGPSGFKTRVIALLGNQNGACSFLDPT